MIKIIVAVDSHFGMGYKNELPWYSPEDLKFFKETTINHDVLMGKNTYESLLKRFNKRYFDSVLPKRNNIVLSKSISAHLHAKYTMENYQKAGIKLFQNPEKIFSTYKKEYNKTLFIIGGRETILSTIHLVDEILINIIPGKYTCDTFFPARVYVIGPTSFFSLPFMSNTYRSPSLSPGIGASCSSRISSYRNV